MVITSNYKSLWQHMHMIPDSGKKIFYYMGNYLLACYWMQSMPLLRDITQHSFKNKFKIGIIPLYNHWIFLHLCHLGLPLHFQILLFPVDIILIMLLEQNQETFFKTRKSLDYEPTSYMYINIHCTAPRNCNIQMRATVVHESGLQVCGGSFLQQWLVHVIEPIPF